MIVCHTLANLFTIIDNIPSRNFLVILMRKSENILTVSMGFEMVSEGRVTFRA